MDVVHVYNGISLSYKKKMKQCHLQQHGDYHVEIIILMLSRDYHTKQPKKQKDI